MNELFIHNINNNTGTNKSLSKEKKLNIFSAFYMGNNQNRYLSENQRNLTKFNSQKKISKKDNDSKNKNNNESKNKEAILVSFNSNNINNINNIIIKGHSNLFSKNSKVEKNNKNKNKSHNLSKPKLEIEINNRKNANNISKNYSKVANNKKYKKNISEHDLVNNILNTFTNSNFQNGLNINLNFSSKKKLNREKNKIIKKDSKATDNRVSKQNKSRHASDTKLLRSSSGYSNAKSNMAKTNSFFNGNHSNNLGYISTCGNNPDWTNINFGNVMRISNQKNSYNNKHKTKSSKGPFIGKIIKNYKNNDLNCIFNMNVIPPVSPINNFQDYFKNLYKIEYNNEYRVKKIKNSNKKERNNNLNIHKNKNERDTREKTRTNNDDYTTCKNTMTKTTDISKIKKEKESINNIKYYNDTPEEIHFYVISSIQNGKNMVNNLNKK